MYLRNSSRKMTGIEKQSTANHSVQFSGVIWKTVCYDRKEGGACARRVWVDPCSVHCTWQSHAFLYCVALVSGQGYMQCRTCSLLLMVMATCLVDYCFSAWPLARSHAGGLLHNGKWRQEYLPTLHLFPPPTHTHTHNTSHTHPHHNTYPHPHTSTHNTHAHPHTTHTTHTVMGKVVHLQWFIWGGGTHPPPLEDS